MAKYGQVVQIGCILLLIDHHQTQRHCARCILMKAPNAAVVSADHVKGHCLWPDGLCRWNKLHQVAICPQCICVVFDMVQHSQAIRRLSIYRWNSTRCIEIQHISFVKKCSQPSCRSTFPSPLCASLWPRLLSRLFFWLVLPTWETIALRMFQQHWMGLQIAVRDRHIRPSAQIAQSNCPDMSQLHSLTAIHCGPRRSLLAWTTSRQESNIMGGTTLKESNWISSWVKDELKLNKGWRWGQGLPADVALWSDANSGPCLVISGAFPAGFLGQGLPHLAMTQKETPRNSIHVWSEQRIAHRVWKTLNSSESLKFEFLRSGNLTWHKITERNSRPSWRYIMRGFSCRCDKT